MNHKTWIFDLDDTLHHASGGIFDHINKLMTEYMMRQLGVDEAEACALRSRYWAQYARPCTACPPITASIRNSS